MSSGVNRGGQQPGRRATIDGRIARIAQGQRGLITRQQLLGEVGLGSGAVHSRLASGQLTAVHRGVYRLAGPPLRMSWAMAAALACGSQAAVSGRSAAAVHEIGPRGPRIEITAPREHRHAGVDCRIVRLSPDDLMVRFDVPVTTVARTVYDVAGRADCSDARLAELVHRARLAKPGLLDDLDVLLVRVRGRGRSRMSELRLRPYLADQDGPVRSVFEREVRRALADSDLPPAQFNVAVGGLEVDALWPAARVVVELDGYAYHGDRAAFERDRERDARLGALHHQVIRITWRRWRDDRNGELSRLRKIILARTRTSAAGSDRHPPRTKRKGRAGSNQSTHGPGTSRTDRC